MPRYRFEFGELKGDPSIWKMNKQRGTKRVKVLAERILLIEIQRSETSTSIYNEAGDLVDTVTLSEAIAEEEKAGVVRFSLKVSRG